MWCKLGLGLKFSYLDVVVNISDATISSKRYIESILAISYRIDIIKKNIEILIYRYRFNIGETMSMLSVYFLFVGNKSRTAHIMTLKRSLARRPIAVTQHARLKIKI